MTSSEDTKMSKNENIKIYISHSPHDRRGAETLRTFLEMYSPNVEVFTSSSDVENGSDLRDLVEKRVIDSGLMILILSDNTEHWKWCLYEVGLYRGVSESIPRPLVVFHPTFLELPSAFKAYQSFPLDNESISHFLHSFFAGNLTPQFGRPINEKIANSDKEINRATKEILAAIESHFWRKEYLAWNFMLILDKDCIEQLQKSGEIPEESVVSMTHSHIDIFKISKDEVTWSDLKGFFNKKGESHLLNEFNRTIAAHADDIAPPRMTATFRTISNDKIYRPFLSSIQKSTNELCFRFILIEELSPALIGGPGNSGTLFMLLRLASRFKWEVIEPHLKNLESDVRPQSLEELSNSLRYSMEQISGEAANHGFLVREVITTTFESYEERSKIEELLNEWQQNVMRLNTSIDQTDGDVIKKNLIEFKQFNDHFTALVAKRYSEVVRV